MCIRSRLAKIGTWQDMAQAPKQSAANMKCIRVQSKIIYRNWETKRMSGKCISRDQCFHVHPSKRCNRNDTPFMDDKGPSHEFLMKNSRTKKNNNRQRENINATNENWWQQRLKWQRWQRIHREQRKSHYCNNVHYCFVQLPSVLSFACAHENSKRKEIKNEQKFKLFRFSKSSFRLLCFRPHDYLPICWRNFIVKSICTMFDRQVLCLVFYSLHFVIAVAFCLFPLFQYWQLPFAWLIFSVEPVSISQKINLNKSSSKAPIDG